MSTSTDDDDDFRRAVELSLVQARDGTSIEGAIAIDESPPHVSSVPTVGTDDVASKSALGLAGLNRKVMEEERLARLARKRQRSVSPPALRSPRKAPKVEANTVALPSGARLTTFSSHVEQTQKQQKSLSANEANRHLRQDPRDPRVKSEPLSDEHAVPRAAPDGEHGLTYPNGVVKRTWAFGFDRDGRDIKLEEVLEPATLTTAVLSAFQWNVDWVLSKLRTPLDGRGQTKCVFIMQAKDEQRQQFIEDTQRYGRFLRLCLPSMGGIVNCMHSKLMLLFHPKKLRIAIPTANLLDFDWGETGVMENSVFLIDLPRLDHGKSSTTEGLTSFGKELLFFVEKQGLDQDIRDAVLNFDFKATEAMAFVHTVGGINYGLNGERTGLPGLGRAIRSLSARTNDTLELDFAASSVGSLNDDFLKTLYAAARGEEVIDLADASMSRTKADFFKASKQKEEPSVSSLRDKIRIYFPTHDTVRSSKAGAAGTICLSRKWFEAATFPRAIFRNYRSTRDGLLSHNKILYARGKQTRSGRTIQDVAWTYVGSANMSKSAWGELFYDRKNKGWKVHCRNWECGVILKVPARCFPETSRGDAVAMMKSKQDEDLKEVVEHAVVPAARGAQPEHEDSETEIDDDEISPTVPYGRGLVDMKVFDEVTPPPFVLPGQQFGGNQPWYFQEHAQ